MVNDRFGPIDFDRFHREEVPGRLLGRRRLLTASDQRSLRPLAFRLRDGRSYTYAPDGGAIAITPGDADAHTVVTLSYEDWCSFAWELRSCFALFYADALEIHPGQLRAPGPLGAVAPGGLRRTGDLRPR